MKQDKQFKYIIVAVIIGALVTPFLVTFFVSYNILHYVNTDNQWIGFWGNYFGSILGGIIGGLFTILVLNKTLNDNKESLVTTFRNGKISQDNRELLDFCNYLITKKVIFDLDFEEAIYDSVTVHTMNKKTAKSDAYIGISKEIFFKMDTYKSKHHLATAELNEILLQLILKEEEIYLTIHRDDLIKMLEKLSEEWGKYFKQILSCKFDSTCLEYSSVVDLYNNCDNLLDKHIKCLISNKK